MFHLFIWLTKYNFLPSKENPLTLKTAAVTCNVCVSLIVFVIFCATKIRFVRNYLFFILFSLRVMPTEHKCLGRASNSGQTNMSQAYSNVKMCLHSLPRKNTKVAETSITIWKRAAEMGQIKLLFILRLVRGNFECAFCFHNK